MVVPINHITSFIVGSYFDAIQDTQVFIVARKMKF